MYLFVLSTQISMNVKCKIKEDIASKFVMTQKLDFFAHVEKVSKWINLTQKSVRVGNTSQIVPI